MNIPLRVNVKRAIKISKAGYLHVPLLYFACGINGFLLDLIGISIEVSWGNAVKQYRNNKNNK